MQNTLNIQELEKSAFQSLQTGDNQKAISLFGKITESGKGKFPHWLGLTFAFANVKDFDSALNAIDNALTIEPQNLRAVMLKGDLLKETTRKKECLEYYDFAMKIASQQNQLPPDLNQALNRAHDYMKQAEEERKGYILEKLNAKGFSQLSNASPFKKSIDLLFSPKETFYQQPTRFYYPELPQIQFYERESFDWVAALESKTDKIREELLSVLNDSSRFNPYVNSQNDALGQNNQGLADNKNWSAMFLWQDGNIVEENKAMFPETLKALESVPMPNKAGVAPMALFSKLSAKTKIPPHHGALNTRLICHLPLIVPKDCGALRVGNEQRQWVEGELLIFDDSMEHEAWNNSTEERVVLLFEIWRPEIANKMEQELILTMLGETKTFH